MNTSIATIYENGVLRPLVPLSLPERSRVWVHIVAPEKQADDAKNERQALIRAGLVLPPQEGDEQLTPMSDEERQALARSLGEHGPLSELILEERRTGP